MHSHTARKLTQPWPWRQRALDNIMTAITSLKWPCFRSSVPFMFFSTGPFEFHPHVDAQFIFTIQFCLFIGLTPYLFLTSLFSCHYFSVSVLFFWFKTRVKCKLSLTCFERCNNDSLTVSARSSPAKICLINRGQNHNWCFTYMQESDQETWCVVSELHRWISHLVLELPVSGKCLLTGINS